MSSLTDEQRRRIEENHAKALAKLTEKRSAAKGLQPFLGGNASCSSKNCINSSSSQNQKKVFGSTKEFAHTFYKDHQCRGPFRSVHVRKGIQVDREACATFPGMNKEETIRHQLNSSNHWNKHKNVNDVLGKKKSVVEGTCVLVDKMRFKVVVGFHSQLVGVFKTLPSRSYGKIYHLL